MGWLEGVKKLNFNVAPTINQAYIRFRKCDKKKAFGTKELAEKALSGLILRGKDTDPSRRLEVYRCGLCGKYHVGHGR